MSDEFYRFNLESPFIFFKAGKFIGQPGWSHDYTINNEGDYEFMIVTKGCLYLELAHKKYEVHENECILVPPHTPHFGYLPTKSKTIHYWMHFFPNGKVTQTSSLSVNKPTEICLPILFHLTNLSRFILPLHQLLDSAQFKEGDENKRESHQIHLLANYFTSAIAIELNNQVQSLQKSQPQLQRNQRIELICHWIRLHSNKPLTVKDVATEFNITVPNLTRLMRRYRNTSTIDYIHECKIDLAKNYLLVTDKSIRQIAEDLGYTNVKYFMRLFKERADVTPSQYRNSYTKSYVNNNYVNPMIPLPQDYPKL